jgi:UDP-GlcNAc3NAcA epimerase
MIIATILGARPQFIKASMVSKEIAQYRDIKEVIIHTGQHFHENMSNIFFKEMEIPEPKYNLEINTLPHGAMTGRMLEEIEKTLQKEQPDWVIVYGDTNSTLAGALSAVKMHIPVAHVEAGLRSFNRKMPEEINRVLTDHLCDICFAPTITAIDNLRMEGISEKKTRLVGDVMFDATLYYRSAANQDLKFLKKLDLHNGSYVLATIHRPENTDHPERLKSIVEALNQINSSNTVVLPIHPRTRSKLLQQKIKTDFIIMDPVGYLQMLTLIKNSRIVLTDSGGLQKEAYFLKKCCVTIRNETEWVELVEHGNNVLAGSDKAMIIDSFEKMLEVNADFSQKLYGDGNTSKLIIENLKV